MNYKSPKISIIMSVYNSENYLKEAIDSVINQTFTDFEFIIINDGSTDNSEKIIKEYKDSRICLLKNHENSGLATSLNKGIKAAKGEYIARMDSDDICKSERLRKQIDFMEKNSEVDICGTWLKTIETNHEKIISYPLTDEQIKAQLFFKSPIAHPTVIIRSKIFKKYKIYYNPSFIYGQDYDLWNRLRKKVTFANIPEVLYYYRILPTSQYHSKKLKHPEVLNNVYIRNLKDLKISIDKEKLNLFLILLDRIKPELNLQIVEALKDFVNKIYQSNKKLNVFPEPYFSKHLANYWFYFCFKNKRLGFKILKKFRERSLNKHNSIPFFLKLKFILGAFYFQFLKIF